MLRARQHEQSVELCNVIKQSRQKVFSDQ